MVGAEEMRPEKLSEVERSERIDLRKPKIEVFGSKMVSSLRGA